MLGRPWNSREVQTLRDRAHLGAVDLAKELGRSRRAVESAAARHRISLRTPGNRAGIVLGQPRGVSLRGASHRAALVDDPRLATAIAQRVQLAREAEVCPSCGVNVVTVKRTGWCRSCHLRAQAIAQEEIRAELAAVRERWTARQQLHRERLECERLGVEIPPELAAHIRQPGRRSKAPA